MEISWSILQVLNMLEEFPSLTMGMSFHKEGECRSITAKPTYIKKEKDIPRLPEIKKKLYQYFRLFYFHSHNNIAVISLLLHVVDTYQIRITPQYIFIQILRILYVALRVLNQIGTQILRNEHVPT